MQELIRSRNLHDELLQTVIKQGRAEEISMTTINGRIDGLVRLFTVGFRIVAVCGVIVTTSVGAFWIFSRDLDTRYMPKLNQIESNTANVADDIQDIKSKKVIKDSR